MTTMRFPFGDQSRIIENLLADYRYEPILNHRGQWYYEGQTWWKGMPVTCRLGTTKLDRLPHDLYEEVWSGYYDIKEPDSMVFDAVHANIFAFIKKHHLPPRS